MPKPLIMVAQRLADLLDRENDALRAMDLRLATTLLPEKAAAVAELNTCGATAGGQLAPDLVSIARRLDSLASENRRLLERAIIAQQRVIGIIVAAAAGAMGEPSYGASGRQTNPTGPMTLSTRA